MMGKMGSELAELLRASNHFEHAPAKILNRKKNPIARHLDCFISNPRRSTPRLPVIDENFMSCT